MPKLGPVKKLPVCKACKGTGTNSKGYSCYPCLIKKVDTARKGK